MITLLFVVDFLTSICTQDAFLQGFFYLDTTYKLHYQRDHCLIAGIYPNIIRLYEIKSEIIRSENFNPLDVSKTI